MKRQFLAIPLLFFIFSFFFLLPNKVIAATCESQNGHCDFAIACSGGLSKIPNDNCGWGWVCCPNITATCASLGGKCDVAGSCSIGSPLPGICNSGSLCCPNITATCASLGGHCDTAVACSQGNELLGKCGDFQVCCSGSGNNNRYCNGKDETDGINTAIGCIKVGSGNELINTILRLALGVGGGLALALILYGTFIVTTSAGMPDKLKAGGEIITSAIIGLIFILLSIFLVNLIGINILGIPGFLK